MSSSCRGQRAAWWSEFASAVARITTTSPWSLSETPWVGESPSIRRSRGSRCIARLCQPVFHTQNGGGRFFAATMMPVSNYAKSRRQGTSAANGVPLSHHAIMSLVGPFSRRGYSLDLAASDRAHGVLVFRPVDLPAEPRLPALRSVLRLERPHRAKFRVIRTLEANDGQVATMTAEGDDPEALLEVVEQVDTERQFHVVGSEPNTSRIPENPSDGRPKGPQPLITRSYKAELWVADTPRRGRRLSDTPLPRLTNANARLGPLELVATDGDGWGCEVTLTANDGASIELPTDFLAVLGWGWRPLRPAASTTWQGRVSIALRGRRRTAALEAQLDRAVEHVVETLAVPPSSFHPRHRGARWRAAFQRLVPLLFIGGCVVALVLAVMYLPKIPGLHIALNNLTIVAVAAFVMMDKAYRVEIPPCPGPLKQTKWDSASDGGLSEVPL